MSTTLTVNAPNLKAHQVDEKVGPFYSHINKEVLTVNDTS
jgi:hypothetical protein